MEWVNYVPIGIFQAVTTLVVWFGASYLKEKGRNLATREDVHEITRQIESAKIEYAKELEDLKSQLTTKFHAHTVRFEKEFRAYEEIWTSLFQVMNSVLRLRPDCDFYTTSGQSPEQEKEERFQNYKKSHEIFYNAFYSNLPFIESEICSRLDSVLKIIFLEASAFKNRIDQRIEPSSNPSYFWEGAEKNRKSIIEETDTVSELIRKRIWQSHC